MTVLHEQVRVQVKKPKWTRLMLIDSQAVTNTCNASVASKSFCFYKSTNGIKRHLALDTLGFPFFTHCTRSNVSHPTNHQFRDFRRIKLYKQSKNVRKLSAYFQV